tara:strand:+ start:56 stop:955 length:900 start_codon:yes stop_codon:yes gene_type:complete
MKKKCGFIGFGKHAQIYAKIFKSLNIEIVSICVRDKKKYSKLKKVFSIKEIYDDIDKFCLNSKLDFIMVILPWDEIEKNLPKIVTKVKTELIFSEKPVALSLNKLNKIILLRHKFNKKIYVLYNRRFYETSQYLKKIIKTKKLSKFYMEISERKKDAVELLSKKILGNIRYHLTSHWIDLVMWLFKIKKFQLKKKKSSYHITSDNKYIIKLDYNGFKPISSVITFNKLSLSHNSLEKLYKNNVGKSKLIVDDNKASIYKPGLKKLSEAIKKIANGNNNKDLPIIDDLRNLYTFLSKLKI